MDALKKRIAKFGILGGVFTTLGGLGAFGVCHTICQTIIVVLAAIGITIIGMPLAFLAEPWFIAISLAVGGVFLLGALVMYLRHRKMKGGEQNEVK